MATTSYSNADFEFTAATAPDGIERRRRTDGGGAMAPFMDADDAEPPVYARNQDTRTGSQYLGAASSVLSHHDSTLLAIFYRQLRQCARCDAIYTEVKNLGEWACPARQHVGTYVLPVSYGADVTARWSCCAAVGERSRGCVRAHHKYSAGAYTKRDDVPLSAALASTLHTHLDNATVMTGDGVDEDGDDVEAVAAALRLDDYIVVRRYDAVAARIVMGTGVCAEDLVRRPSPLDGIPRRLWEVL